MLFFSDLKPPGYLVGYVTGDRSVKLAWEIRFPSNNTVFELRWKSNDNESSMVVSGTTGTVTVHNLRVYTRYYFRVRKGLVDGTRGGFTRYTRVWTPEGGKYTLYSTSSPGPSPLSRWRVGANKPLAKSRSRPPAILKAEMALGTRLMLYYSLKGVFHGSAHVQLYPF